MKKNALRAFALLLAVILAGVTFASCTLKSDLSFKNALSTKLLEVYVCPNTSLYWNEDNLVNVDEVKAGATVYFDFSRIGGNSGDTFDVGTIDENGMNYDGYGIILVEGDSITLSGNSTAAKITVTHKDGTTTDYEAMVYENDS